MNRQTEITFTGKLTIPYREGVGFREAQRVVQHALLAGDAHTGDFELDLVKVTKLEMTDCEEVMGE